MGKPLELVRGDTAPIVIKIEVQNAAGVWSVPSLTGATVRLVMVDPTLATEASPGTVVYAKAGAVTDALNGLCAFPRAVDDFGATAATVLLYEVEVTESGGAVRTYPSGRQKGRALLVRDLD